MARRTMRSPRRINFGHEALKGSATDSSHPSVTSESWKLWLACQDVARQALQTEYLRGIANGDLDPNAYGHYTVQDGAYCHHAQGDYVTIEARSSEAGYPELAAFAKARHASYVGYTQGLLDAWHISNADALSPGEASQAYISFEHDVANRLAPIYGVIAMVPCDQLWAWLATELRSHLGSRNIYSFWIKDNDDWDGAYRLDNFIDGWSAEHPGEYRWDEALYVFRSCMTAELNFFRSACGQALVPMPKKPVTR